MKVVIAIDSLKGSLTSVEAGMAAREGILRARPSAQAEVRPLADGGEGTVEALVYGMRGRTRQITVTGPLGEPVECRYGIIDETHTAVMEMAQAAGITLIPREKRNPMFTTTFGVGEMIRDAVSCGCRRFLMGIGGSATNDGGIGMLSALGYEFWDQEGHAVPYGAKGLEKLWSVSGEHVIPELAECEFRIACDVINPLCGENGCSAVYGPQKGASEEMIGKMDRWMERYAHLAKQTYPNADPDYPGAGAAGGMGFAFLTFANAVLESGIQIVLEETNLEQYVKEADYVVTGEGQLDGQTAMGKAPVGVARLAKKYGKKVIAFAGSVTADAKDCNREGIDAYFPILRRVCTLEEAMDKENAFANLADTAEQVFRLLPDC